MIMSGTDCMAAGSRLTKLPSIIGCMSAAKPVLVAANTSIAITAIANMRQCGAASGPRAFVDRDAAVGEGSLAMDIASDQTARQIYARLLRYAAPRPSP